jgi:NitT/TauT family transport system ATP-binding protein
VSTVALACRQVRHGFRTNGGLEVAALENVSFDARPGEFLCLVGPSGCGKTTLLKIIAGLLQPSGGSVTLTGHRENEPPRCAVVFQEHGVFPWMTVLENVAFGLEMRGAEKVERERRAREFIGQIGLGAFAGSYPHELSVGMRQRVGIARAFVTDAELLLLDEPFGALDAQTKLVLEEELLRVWAAHRKLVVYVTHDIEEAVLLGDRVLVMSGRPGHIREEIEIPLPRPRLLAAWQDPTVNDLKWHIWQLLEREVRTGLSIVG